MTANTRIHIGLGTRNVEEAVRFYRGLFEQEPTKRRDDYAKFELDDPGLLLSVTHHEGAGRPALPQHFGIQVHDPKALAALRRRVEQAGLAARVEDQVTCCYAVSDKVWVEDPDGNKWELFLTTADADVASAGRVESEDAPCCGPECCT